MSYSIFCNWHEDFRNSPDILFAKHMIEQLNYADAFNQLSQNWNKHLDEMKGGEEEDAELVRL